MSNDQKQKAGDGSVQIQVAGNLTVGVTEARAKEIFREMFSNEMSNLVAEAKEQASKRIGILENKLLAEFETCQDLLNQFKKPEFLYLLQLAEKSAIQTDSEHGYDILVHLLLNKAKNENDKKFGIGVKQAIQIVDELDDDSILGLTGFFVYGSFSSNSKQCYGVLDTMNDIYESIGVEGLPLGRDWMDQLDVLKCIRIMEVTSFATFEDYYLRTYSGVFTLGLKKGSPKHLEALKLLNDNGLPGTIFVENELNPEYVRLFIGSEKDIDSLCLDDGTHAIELSAEQKDCLRHVYSSYSKDKDGLENIKKALVEEIEKRPYLAAFRKWINALGAYGELTCVGRAIAYTEVKMKRPDLADVYEKSLK